jgi:hypothetical protein
MILVQRVATTVPAGEAAADDPPAISLLEEVPALENQLLAVVAGADEAAKLKQIDWEDVCAQVSGARGWAGRNTGRFGCFVASSTTLTPGLC